MRLKSVITKRPTILLSSLLLTIGIFFRLHALNYSEFQGDEVAAQNFLFGEQSFIDFLFSRTIGPGQSIIAYITNLFFAENGYIRLLTRLPFSIANICALGIAAYTIKEKFNTRAGVYTLILISLNGLFIAFGRIVQYQSFIILFAVLNFYLLSKYLNKENSKHLVLLGTLNGSALLFHYDALTFILPTILILVIKFNAKKVAIINMSKYFLPLTLIPAIFFVPYATYPTFYSSINYLLVNRIGSFFEFDSVYYSFKILLVYLSKEYILGIAILSGMVIISNIANLTKWKNAIILSLLMLVSARFGFQQYNLSLRALSLIFGIILCVYYVYDLYKTTTLNNFFRVWFLFCFLTYGLFFSKPLTHIYTILLPGIMLLSVELARFVKQKGRGFKMIINLILALLVISSISYNFNAFIDTRTEYPWNNKQYIFGNMHTSIASGDTIAGIFGFPYYRNWNEIQNTIQKTSVEYYSSNEKYNVTKYYMQGYKRNDDLYDLYIYIHKPQTNILNKPSLKDFDMIKESNTYEVYIRTRYFETYVL